MAFENSSSLVTRLLSDWSKGDKQALNELMPAVYSELHRIARLVWGSHGANHTLQPTALIHEAYLKLANSNESSFQSRGHFFAVASMAMRQILVTHAQSNLTAKRGGDKARIPLDDADQFIVQESSILVDLHEALKALEAIDPRKSRVVEMRYFGGMSIEETADALKVSVVTVNRDWRLARIWLIREMNRTASS